MPLFEYTCRGCGKDFEALVSHGESPTCPSCESGDLDKKFSVFAKPIAAESSVGDFGSCRTCGSPDGPGSCGLN